jgi:ABC-type ATPase involved in cell division
MVIDEPFTALDLDSAEWGRRVLADRARAGAAILFSSHDTALVHALAHRTIALESGRVSRT